MTGRRAPVREAPHRRTAIPGAVLLTAVLLWALTWSLNTEPLTGEPLLPEYWTSAAVIAIVAVAIALTCLSVYVVWRYPRTRMPRVHAPQPRRPAGGPGRDRDWRTVILFLLYFIVITALFTVINRLMAPNEVVVQDNGQPTDAAPTTNDVPPVPEGPDLTPVLFVGLLILVGLLAIGTILAMRGRRPQPAAEAFVTVPPEHPHSAEPLLEEAAQRGLNTIRKPATDPRAAIIACYTEMERALSTAEDAAPLESDTPTEVLVRAVAAGYVRRAPAEELVLLFEEARYSSHMMTPAHRDRATDLLRTLLDDVRRAPSEPSS